MEGARANLPLVGLALLSPSRYSYSYSSKLTLREMTAEDCRSENEQPATAVAPAPPIELGTTIGPYRIERLLGRGGMGVVYRATDERLDRQVAIKFLLPERLHATARRRFEREARLASALNHPHILTVYDAGDYAGSPYLVTELVDGGTLEQWVGSEPRAWRRTVELMIGIADALAAAHAANILHRDVKPGNILLTRAGYAKLADFGLAKPANATDSYAGDGSLVTRADAVIGTPAYMSPEQIAGAGVDARTDIFAFGVVLYELFAGRRPFGGATDVDVMHAVRHAPAATLPSEIPQALRAIVEKAIEKDPNERYQSMRDFVVDLKRVVRSSADADPANAATGPAARASVARWVVRQPIAASIAVVLVVAAAGVVYLAWHRSAQERWAREEAIPTIARLADEGDHRAAFELAERAKRYAPNDLSLRSLTPLFSLPYEVTSTPAGADVYVRGYAEPGEDWQLLGRTPLTDVSVARRPLHWRIEKEGFEPAERATSIDNTEAGPSIIDATLQPRGGHSEMIYISGGTTRQFMNGAIIPPLPFDSFFIDRYEVTNAEYKEFLDAGGYEQQSYWEGLEIERGGARLGWEEAMRLFVDSTGRHGPAAWEVGSYPPGEERHPVSGVSWYEAVAYARFRGKSLPTMYHWATAGLPPTSVGNLPAALVPESNFGSSGPAAVGTYRGLGPYGTYDMHGNVAEWTWNRSSPDRAWTLGGSWRDAAYNYFAGNPAALLERSPTIGFRLMDDAGASAATPALFEPVELNRPQTLEAPPASDEVYAAYAEQFAYSHGDLAASDPVTVEATDDWVRQRVSVDAGYGERLDIVLFIPTNAKPPYQVVVYGPPPVDALRSKFSTASLAPGHREAAHLDFLVKSGRVFVHPIYQGTYERFRAPINFGDAPALQRLWVDWRWDVGRTIDYLETRADIDADKIAYAGVSFGAVWPVHLLAVESRFRAAMFISGGAPLLPLPPSIDAVHYLPRITIPVLAISGRFDYVNPLVAHRKAFELLGTAPTRKRHVIVEAGHVIPRADLLRESLPWLDEYLAPVQ